VGENPTLLTCTVLNWIPLFTRPDTVEIVLDAIRYRQQKLGWRLYGFVVLENHLHLILQTQDLREELMRFKSYTACRLIDYLEERGVQRILEQVARLNKHHKGDRDNQLWEEGSHPQLIESEDVLRQKLHMCTTTQCIAVTSIAPRIGATRVPGFMQGNRVCSMCTWISLDASRRSAKFSLPPALHRAFSGRRSS